MLLALPFVMLPAPYVLTAFIPHRELAEEERRVQITWPDDMYLLTVQKYGLERTSLQDEQSFMCCVVELHGRTGEVLG